MRLLDRYIIRSFLMNYVLAFIVIVGMYVMLDLIVNFYEFTTTSDRQIQGWDLTVAIISDIADFYMYQILLIFQQMAVTIPIMAAGFTMVRMTRHNELIAMLASGVSLYRVAAPVIICSLLFATIAIVNQELVVPQFRDKLMRRHEQVSKVVDERPPVQFLRDKDNSLLSASSFDPKKNTLQNVRIIQRDEKGSARGRIIAETAQWVPMPGTTDRGAWFMPRATIIDDSLNSDPALKVAGRVEQLNYNTGLSPRQLELAISRKAADLLGTSEIQELIVNSPIATKPKFEKILHTRVTQPIMNLIMLLVSVPFLLTRDPRQLVVNMIRCTLVSALCFAGTFVFFQAAGTVFPAIIGAWLPVIIFGPIALVLMDSLKT
ncbi:MAG: LptF/LptG family permease [Phycisphaerae bacterium]